MKSEARVRPDLGSYLGAGSTSAGGSSTAQGGGDVSHEATDA